MIIDDSNIIRGNLAYYFFAKGTCLLLFVIFQNLEIVYLFRSAAVYNITLTTFTVCYLQVKIIHSSIKQ